jgi:transcriptional regulator with XRE-family HTH domain
VLTGEEDDPEEVYALYERPGQRLAALREVLRALPREAVAQEAGITRANLSRIVNGKAVPRGRTRMLLERVARQKLDQSPVS